MTKPTLHNLIERDTPILDPEVIWHDAPAPVETHESADKWRAVGVVDYHGSFDKWGFELVEDFVRERYPLFAYHVNLDERGCFYADVRDSAGKSVFEIRVDGDSDRDTEEFFGVDGYMRHKDDIDGLEKGLKHLGIVPADADVLTESDFEHNRAKQKLEERVLESAREVWSRLPQPTRQSTSMR